MMNLFDQSNPNLLPRDGTAIYYGHIMNRAQADHYFQQLLESIQWKADEVVIFGKHIVTKRMAVLYSEERISYNYSNVERSSLPWTTELLQLKNMVEEKTQTLFNSCLLNLYHSGEEGMGWHSDDEKSMIEGSTIASLSLGAERKFAFKHKISKEKVELILQHGSLLLMQDETQQFWKHSLPKTKKVSRPRINLTFRNIAG